MLKKQYSKGKPVCKVTFSLPMEAAKQESEVKILGDFNNWSEDQAVVMKANDTEFKATVELEAGREYQFRYLIDNRLWENDWKADRYVPTPFGVHNSVVALEAVPAAGRKPATRKATVKKVASGKATVKKAASGKAAPKKQKANSADDLSKIEGIGPKIAQLVNAAGIRTFSELSKTSKAALVKILEEAGSRYRMHDPSTWAQQAKLAAKGEWEKLNQLQDKLKGGKKK